MIYFVITTKGTSVERLVQLFRDNVWKLYILLMCIVSDRGLKFAAELIKELNRMLGIETELSTSFYLQTDSCYETLWTWTIFIFFFFYFLTP